MRPHLNAGGIVIAMVAIGFLMAFIAPHLIDVTR